MILVDTSIWIDHLRTRVPPLADLLSASCVLGHPWVVGELALGQLARRQEILGLLRGLPQAEVATAAELLTFVDRHALSGLGIGHVDAQLLAATQLTPDARLWTNDKRLAVAAMRLGLAVHPDGSKRMLALMAPVEEGGQIGRSEHP